MKLYLQGAAALLSVSVLTSLALGQAPVAADNSKTNQTDASHIEASADAQQNNATDLALTQQIRRSVMADKSLSTYAQNVKIVSMNGTVTLNGVVRSENEKSNVQMKAVAVAGSGHVVNDLTIAPPK
jgi:hyperosmotically inducible periplasmic protein